MTGLVVIFQIPSRDLKRLQCSSIIGLSPHPSDRPARSSIVPLRSPIVPAESCNTLRFTDHYPPHTRAQISSTPVIDHLSTMAPSTQHNTSSHTSYDSRRESVSGADSNIMNPFSRFTSKVFSLSTWAKLIIQKGINRLLSQAEPTGSDDKQARSQ